MNLNCESLPGNESLLDQVIAEYLRAEADGKAGNHQFWLDRYPGCAKGLAAFFNDRDCIGKAMTPVRIGAHVSPIGSGATDLYSPSLPVIATVDFQPEPPCLSSTRYRPLSFHARGGMGEIWLAEDERIGRRVAVKKLRTGRETQQARFLAEAQITGQLEHPSIVPLHDMGIDDAGQPFYVMKFIHGCRLNDAIAEFHSQKSGVDWPNDVKFRRLLETFVSICNVVAYAHDKGVVHRDIKPENVMLGPYGETLMVDWGLAKVLGGSDETRHSGVRLSGSGSTATQDGAVIGSPYYMSPEGAEGRPDAVDQSSDVYLLGATLYEVLTAQPPRRGSSSWELIDSALHIQPMSPRKLDPEIPRALEAICMKALAFKKQNRYESPMALAEDVERYLAGASTTAYHEPILTRARRWVRRHRRVLQYAVLAATLLALAGIAADRYRYANTLAFQERARRDLNEFNRLADEAQYFAANVDSIAERVPYYDPRRAILAGEAAIAIAAPWGKSGEHFPLTNERDEFQRVRAELLLRMAQLQLHVINADSSPRKALDLLDCAGTTAAAGSRGYHELRSQALARLGATQASQLEVARSIAPETSVTAQDHFLAGERMRLQDAGVSSQILGNDEVATRKHLAAAVEEYRECLKLEPRHFWARFQLGHCLLAMGRSAEAIESLSACIALRPNSPWAYSTRGLAHAIGGRSDEALSDLDQAMRIDPKFEPARLNRGIAHWLQRDHDKALSDFAAVLSAPADRRLIEAAYYRGQMLLGDKLDGDALADFSSVLSAWGDFQPAYWFRAQANFRLGNFTSGLVDVKHYVALNARLAKNSPTAEQHLLLGKALRKLAQQLPDPARTKVLVAATKELARDNETHTGETFKQLGAVYELRENLPEAIDAYSAGLARSPNDSELLILRGWALANDKQYKSARADFMEALRISPHDAEAHTGLGFVLAELGRNDDARQEASTALLIANGNQLILHNVACIYAKLSTKESERRLECENLALAALDRAVSTSLERPINPGTDELTLIRNERWFPESLKSRPEFERLFSRKNVAQ